ncbi:MAG: hypothetical protein QM733_05700 [Ilumatobacteraceae bacterium]
MHLGGGDEDAVARIGVLHWRHRPHAFTHGQIDRDHLEGRCFVVEHGHDRIDVTSGQGIALLLDGVGQFHQRMAADAHPASGVGLRIQLVRCRNRKPVRSRHVPDEDLRVSEKAYRASVFEIFAGSCAHLPTELARMLAGERRAGWRFGATHHPSWPNHRTCADDHPITGTRSNRVEPGRQHDEAMLGDHHFDGRTAGHGAPKYPCCGCDAAQVVWPWDPRTYRVVVIVGVKPRSW